MIHAILMLVALAVLLAIAWQSQQGFLSTAYYFLAVIDWQGAKESYPNYGILLFGFAWIVRLGFVAGLIWLFVPKINRWIQPDKNRQSHFLFLVFVFVLLLLSLQYHKQYSLFDDAEYLQCANRVLHGENPFSTTFHSNRPGVYLPIALAMHVFGFSTWLTLVTTVEFFFLLVTVYFGLVRYNKRIAVWSIFLLCGNRHLLYSASVCMGDIISTLAMVAPLFLYFYSSDSTDKRLQRRMGLLSGLAVIYAALSKESIVYYALLLILLAYIDWKKASRFSYWKYMCITILVGGLTTLLVYGILTDDLFFRISNASLGNTLTASEAMMGSNGLLMRVTIQPVSFLLNDFAVGIVYFLAFLNFLIRSDSKPARFFKIYLAATLPVWWFGSINANHWYPVPLVERLWFPVFVPACINASFALYELVYKPVSAKLRNRIIAASFVFLLAVFGNHFFLMPTMNYGAGSSQTMVAYLLSVVAICVSSCMNTENVLSYGFHKAGLVLLVMLFPLLGIVFTYYDWIKKSPPTYYTLEKKAFEYALEIREPTAKIISDLPLVRNYGIYNGFTASLPVENILIIDTNQISKGDLLFISTQRLQDLQQGISESKYKREKNYVPTLMTEPEKYGFREVKMFELNRVLVKE